MTIPEYFESQWITLKNERPNKQIQKRTWRLIHIRVLIFSWVNCTFQFYKKRNWVYWMKEREWVSEDLWSTKQNDAAVRLLSNVWIFVPLLPTSNHSHEVLRFTDILWVNDWTKSFIPFNPPTWVWKILQRNVPVLHKKLPSPWKISDTNYWKVCLFESSKGFTLMTERFQIEDLDVSKNTHIHERNYMDWIFLFVCKSCEGVAAGTPVIEKLQVRIWKTVPKSWKHVTIIWNIHLLCRKKETNC